MAKRDERKEGARIIEDAFESGAVDYFERGQQWRFVASATALQAAWRLVLSKFEPPEDDLPLKGPWLVARELFVLALRAPIIALKVWSYGFVAHLIWTWHLAKRFDPWSTGELAAVFLIWSLWTTRLARRDELGTRTEFWLTLLLVLAAPWVFLLVAWWLR